MGLREDVRYMLHSDWEPKVPNEEEILRQSKIQIKKGKSTGSVALDVKAIESLSKEKER